jgi:hypothetical protein
MQNLTVSLSENVLKLTLTSKDEFKSLSAQVDPSMVKGHEITDVQGFTGVLQNLVKEITAKNSRSYRLNFLVEPADVILKFVVVNKKNGDPDEQILEEIKTKLEGESLEDLYFSYEKIAPFVYQFVGIKKEKLEKYLEISNSLGIELRSVVPWLLLLPKMVANSEACIFISNNNGSQTIALSELNGIYFSGVYETNRTSKELGNLVSELSVYKRIAPITKIYTLTDEQYSFDENYKVIPLIPSGEEFKELKGFELHAVLDKLLEEDPSLPTAQANLLQLFPLPAVSNKNSALVYVSAVMVALVILGGAFVLLSDNGIGDITSRLARETQDDTAVLGDLGDAEDPELEESEEPEAVELNREDLIIRVENASNIDGVASRTREFLAEKGYVLEQIEIGNAEETGRENTLLRFKDSKMMYASLVSQDMEENYEVITGGGLDENSEFDLLILVGIN